MKKIIYITILFFSISAGEIIANQTDLFDSDSESHELLSIDRSLCLDHDHDGIDEHVIIPEEPLWKQWLTRVGCMVVARCYSAKEYLDEKYENTKKSVNNLMRYFFAQREINKKRLVDEN